MRNMSFLCSLETINIVGFSDKTCCNAGWKNIELAFKYGKLIFILYEWCWVILRRHHRWWRQDQVREQVTIFVAFDCFSLLFLSTTVSFVWHMTVYLVFHMKRKGINDKHLCESVKCCLILFKFLFQFFYFVLFLFVIFYLYSWLKSNEYTD